MPAIDKMGVENSTQGICGFTSTMYALYENHPQLRGRLSSALQTAARTMRLRAEIKTFLVMMKADNKQDILDAITNFTRGFAGYEGWSVDGYIAKINSVVDGINVANRDYSIAMPPIALMEYMRTMWDLRPAFVPGTTDRAGVILGLTNDRAPAPEANQVNPSRLKHYVYQGANGRIYSWGQQFDDMAALQRYRIYGTIFYITAN